MAYLITPVPFSTTQRGQREKSTSTEPESSWRVFWKAELRRCPVAPVRRRRDVTGPWTLPPSQGLSHRSGARSLWFVLKSTALNIFPAFRGVASLWALLPFPGSHTPELGTIPPWALRAEPLLRGTGRPPHASGYRHAKQKGHLQLTCLGTSDIPGASAGEGGGGGGTLRPEELWVLLPKPDTHLVP